MRDNGLNNKQTDQYTNTYIAMYKYNFRIADKNIISLIIVIQMSYSSRDIRLQQLPFNTLYSQCLFRWMLSIGYILACLPGKCQLARVSTCPITSEPLTHQKDSVNGPHLLATNNFRPSLLPFQNNFSKLSLASLPSLVF